MAKTSTLRKSRGRAKASVKKSTTRSGKRSANKTSSKAKFPPGEYYIGDIAYALKEEFYFGVWAKNKFKNGTVREPSSGRYFAVAGTGGDGTFKGSNGYEYGVDAGNIGLVPVELSKGKKASKGGTWHKFTKPVRFQATKKKIIVVSGSSKISISLDSMDEEETHHRPLARSSLAAVSEMVHYFSTRSPGWQFDRVNRGRRIHHIHITLSPEGEILAKEYARYHRRSLWPKILAFLIELDLLVNCPVKLAEERDDTSSDSDDGDDGDPDPDRTSEERTSDPNRYFVRCILPNPGWEDMAAEVLKELDREAHCVWKVKSALSLSNIVEERLTSLKFMLRAVLAFSESHGTQATRELLEAKGML